MSEITETKINQNYKNYWSVYDRIQFWKRMLHEIYNIAARVSNRKNILFFSIHRHRNIKIILSWCICLWCMCARIRIYVCVYVLLMHFISVAIILISLIFIFLSFSFSTRVDAGWQDKLKQFLEGNCVLVRISESNSLIISYNLIIIL